MHCHDPVTPEQYAQLPAEVKQHYETTMRLNGAGEPMHFAKTYIVVARRDRCATMYFHPDSPNWLTGFRNLAFPFTSQAQADMSLRMLATNVRYKEFTFAVEPRQVFRCPECCQQAGQPHKQDCSLVQTD